MRKQRAVDPDKEYYWRMMFERFHESGLPFRKFCELEGLSPNTFQYWRRELRLRDQRRGVKSSILKGDNRPSNLDEKVEYWLKVINEASNYPGSVRTFCRQRGISSGNLHHWQSKLKEMGLSQGVSKGQDPKTNVLIPIRVVDKSSSASKKPTPVWTNEGQRIEIRLPDGKTMVLPATMPADVLIKLFNGLRDL